MIVKIPGVVRLLPVLKSLAACVFLLVVCGMPALAQQAGQDTFPRAVGADLTVTVKAGDNLYTMARAHRLGLEHLAFANGLPVSLQPVKQESLLIPQRRILPDSPPHDGLVLNLPERGLFLFRDGEYRGFYPVAIGGLGWETPTGKYEVAVKTVDPIWFPPAWAGVGHPVMPGPQNPLGDRWIGLSRRGYGIHSTDRPDSIGGAVSHGCIRSYPEHARELFEQVYVGMPIRIEYRPVKLGADPESGQVEMVVFPDVYGRVNLLSEAQKLFDRHGLRALVESDQVRAAVARKSGVATPVFGRRILLDTGSTVVECSGFMKQGRLYVESAALEQLGFDREVPSEQVVHLMGKDFVPAAAALEGRLLQWDGSGGKLYIRSGEAENDQPAGEDREFR